MISHRLIWEHFWFLGYESDGSSQRLRIREQLEQLKVSATFLTTSQRRNIKRQSYLNEVSQRNDSTFFATIGAFGLLPARNRKSVRLKKQITEKAATRNPIYLRY
ncbi:hypothetical protein MTR_5g016040 [Medicago truncatula]|uniref:Uncharacterized protein n=1 Tax=Medicago truncatula TaxID=3880 RepID=G7IU10_MEDTR|nr:hypothetical protein MTR_5g016040 [Medicago truncatula]